MTAAPRRPALAMPVLAVLAALTLVACGRAGRPVAPELRVPQPVGQVGAVVREGAVVLTFTTPRRRVDGSRLVGLALAHVFRVDDAGAGEPRPALLAGDRIVGYQEVATIRLADPAGSPFVRDGQVVYPDRRGLAYGRRYTYVVVTTDEQGRTSPPSPRVSVAFVAAPEPPAAVRAEPGEQEARLSWQPPARLTDGSPVTAPLVYEILRAPAPDAPRAAVARTAPGATTAADRGLENDRTYHYAVRAIRAEDGVLAEGEPSARVAVTPADMTPPSPPTNLVAIPSEGTVRLSWSPSPEPDVAAYVVYRAQADGAFERVGSARAPDTTFVDRDVPRGAYRYAVTAQDAGARANESARSAPAPVAVP